MSFNRLIFIPTVCCIPHSDVSGLVFVVVGGRLALLMSCLNPPALNSAQ